MVCFVYSMVYDELEKEYVIVVCLDGVIMLNILWFVILLNIIVGLVIEIIWVLLMVILDIVVLGFLDFGVQFFFFEWGVMLGDVLELIYVVLWIVMLFGVVIMFSVLLVNLFGDGICCVIIVGVE